MDVAVRARRQVQRPISEEDRVLLETARQFLQAGNEFIPRVNNFVNCLKITEQQVMQVRRELRDTREHYGVLVVVMIAIVVSCTFLGGLMITVFVPSGSAPVYVLFPARLCGLVALVLSAFAFGLVIAIDKRFHPW